MAGSISPLPLPVRQAVQLSAAVTEDPVVPRSIAPPSLPGRLVGQLPATTEEYLVVLRSIIPPGSDF